MAVLIHYIQQIDLHYTHFASQQNDNSYFVHI